VALSQSSLGADLEALFGSTPGSAADAAQGMAQAYYDYAAAGQFGASTPSLTTAHRDAMAGVLLAAIATPVTGSPATLAGAYATAVAAFWLAVPVVGAQTGATVGCPGAPVLVAALTAVFVNLTNTAATCAAGMAAVLHTATLTVTAAVAPPPGTVLPIA
jgi:hypothetical protein